MLLPSTSKSIVDDVQSLLDDLGGLSHAARVCFWALAASLIDGLLRI